MVLDQLVSVYLGFGLELLPIFCVGVDGLLVEDEEVLDVGLHSLVIQLRTQRRKQI